MWNCRIEIRENGIFIIRLEFWLKFKRVNNN